MIQKVNMIRKYHNHTLQTNPRYCEEGYREEEPQNIYSNNTSVRESRQFNDKTVHRHTFEDSSPTELKTVHRQNYFIFYIVFIMNVTCFTIIWDTIKHMTIIKLLKLNTFCGTSYFLLDMYLCLMHIDQSLHYLYIQDWSELKIKLHVTSKDLPIIC